MIKKALSAIYVFGIFPMLAVTGLYLILLLAQTLSEVF